MRATDAVKTRVQLAGVATRLALILLLVALIAYVLGVWLEVGAGGWSLRLVTLGLELVRWDSNTRSLSGLTEFGRPEAGTLFATAVLAGVTAWLAFETRRVAREGHEVSVLNATEIELLEVQTRTLQRQADATRDLADASKAQLEQLARQRSNTERPILDWSTPPDGPWFQADRDNQEMSWVIVACDATNVGGIAVVGPTIIGEGIGFIHEPNFRPRLLRGQSMRVQVSFGPFRRGQPFETSCVLRQSYQALDDSAEQIEDSVLIWTAHDWKYPDAHLRVLQVFPAEADYALRKNALLAAFKANAVARRTGLLLD
ncbi:MAG: hypothetical protein M3P18_25585 [Actinomycetota bacterium]|nr:hypothetical protein [Actinomycetota bacterium]